jgi:hypothetical protein
VWDLEDDEALAAVRRMLDQSATTEPGRVA